MELKDHMSQAQNEYDKLKENDGTNFHKKFAKKC